MKTIVLNFWSLLLLSSCVDLGSMMETSSKGSSNQITNKVTRATVLKEIALNGRAQAAKVEKIRSPEDLSVKDLLVEVGTPVKKGDILLKLDQEKSLKQLNEKQQEFDAFEGSVRSSKIQLENTKKDFLRSKRLYKSGAVSLSNMEQSQAAYKIAKIDIQAKEKELETRKEQLEQFKKQVELLDIKAPFDGVVTYCWKSKKQFSKGESVKKGDMLMMVAANGKMVIESSVREQDVRFFQKDMEVDLLFPTLGGLKDKGTVSYVDFAANIDETTGVSNFRIFVEFEPPENYRMGMEVKATHTVAKKENVVAIPRSALGRVPSGEFFVKKEDSSGFQKVKVDVGVMGESLIEIVSGIKEGDIISSEYE